MTHSVPEFFPSALYSGIVRMDSPVRNIVPMAYEHDKRYFSTHKGRKQYIRKCLPGEFGQPILESPHSLYIQVLVRMHSIGIHEVMAVYLGNPPFDENDTTDAEITQVLIEMDRLHGISPVEWNIFTRRWNEYVKATDLASQKATQ